ncbi:hypothetical protein [Dietzia maris]|uniref:hypothetical protein n=1 Tax=Dietzia maris TaxID=37915 RepID=UPI0037C8115A
MAQQRRYIGETQAEQIATETWQKYFGDYAFVTRAGMRPLIAREYVAELSQHIAVHANEQIEGVITRLQTHFIIDMEDMKDPRGNRVRVVFAKDIDKAFKRELNRIRGGDNE